jgi:hypothetical protein
MGRGFAESRVAGLATPSAMAIGADKVQAMNITNRTAIFCKYFGLSF